MSLTEEIPAFSIWETFSETIPALMSIKSSEKSLEHFAKIVKSGDFSNIFVYNRDLSMSLDQYQTVADKYKSFTTWFLGRFFYMLSCKKLCKNHNVYVDIQLCILNQLSSNQLHVYCEMAQDYSNALNNLVKFVRSGGESMALEVFKPVQYVDLRCKLDLSPVSIEITRKNYEEFLFSLLKVIRYILNQSFDFGSFDKGTHRILDNLLFFVSEGSLNIKFEILDIYIEIGKKIELGAKNHDLSIVGKMLLFAKFFEQIIYMIYDEKFAIRSDEIVYFENLLLRFLELKESSEEFSKITNFLLNKGLANNGLTPSMKIQNICKNKRKKLLHELEDFENFVNLSLANYNTIVLCGLKTDIVNNINKFRREKERVQEIKLYNQIPGKWPQFCNMLFQNLESAHCGTSCPIKSLLEFLIELTKILIEIRIEVKNEFKIAFVDEVTFFMRIISILNQHFAKCSAAVDFELIFEYFLNFSFICDSWNLNSSFNIFAATFNQLISQYNNPPSVDNGRYKKEINDFLKNLSRYAPHKEIAFEFLNKFLAQTSCGFFQVHQIQDMEVSYLRICKQLMAQNKASQLQVIKHLPHCLTLFSSERMISEILIPALSSDDSSVLKETTRILPKIICMLASDFVKLSKIDPQDGSLKIEIFCEKCHLTILSKSDNREKKLEEFVEKTCKASIVVGFSKIGLDLSSLTGTILKNVLKFLTFNDIELKLAALEVLSFCSNHILKFYSTNVIKIWVDKSGDHDETVRRKCGTVIAKIIKNGQENELLSETIKSEVIATVFTSLTNLAKKSLQESDYKLQETILHTVHEICNIKCEATVLPTIKILTFFIMIPTSKHSLIAVNKLFYLAEKHNTTTSQLYKQYKHEICDLVVHLCVVNQALIDYTIDTSLCKISVTLEFYSSKDFVTRECQYLLPFFIARVIKTPPVAKLVEEIAGMVKSSVPELLASTYGNIFLHTFLNETKDDFKACTLYMEKTTGLTRQSLCKRNLWVILNELLLNFNEKRDKVLLALKFLASEDSDNKTDSAQEYLQSRFLGVLQHFDFKLMARNTNKKSSVLRSLADLFRFMEPRHIAPLRFKIIAMLRTAHYGDLTELNCEVWSAFIRSCDVESLAPQLATISVSVLPLLKTHPRQINDIFKYLIEENEFHTKDYIKDLFFIDDQRIDNSVAQIIKRHVKTFESCSLKEQLRSFLKYSTHETLEVRVKSLQQVKLLMEKNREELDRMILGYNGIDPIIVELMDILTLGCREKDPVLRLACGEVIGELGAVEPSHLPRRYTENSRNFVFFIDDDTFIVNALNELTKALQGEKNTVNMDRFAVAIQEILKNCEISSNERSSRHHLWRSFPDWQQELMAPLLTSRYIIAQPTETSFPNPVYGSVAGASLQSWLYNWTRSLISTLTHNHQSILTPCLPAMKQDQRILMQFLPHILLHSIIGDSQPHREKAYVEIKTVINTFSEKKKIDPTLLDIRPIPIPYVTPTIESITSDEIKQTQCTKVIFVLLDFLERWTREWQWTKGSQGRDDANLTAIKHFLNRLCKLQLAKCNYQCAEYPRALMYLEDYITENPKEISSQLSFLSEIYAQLDEADGVAGVTALQNTEPTIEQRILALEVSGKLSDAAACYESLPQPLKMNHFQGLIQCYLDLDNVNIALNLAQGALYNTQPEFGNMLLEMQAEPLWRLGRYDDLDTLVKRPGVENNPAWGVQIGKALLSFQSGDRTSFDNVVQKLKSQQVELLGAASLEEGSYQHGYCYISRLHALNELQQAEKVTHEILSKPKDNAFVEKKIKVLAKEWELRIKVVQESVRIVEPLLCLRRVVIEQAKRRVEGKIPGAVPYFNSLLGECWMSSANIARKAGIYQQSYTYSLKAEEYAPPSLFVEKAQLHWMREEQEQALTTLKRGLEVILPNPSKTAVSVLPDEKRKLCAKAKLLIASYNDAISNVDTTTKLSYYKDSVDVYREWENGWVKLAQFYDRRFQAYSEEERDANGSELQIRMIDAFTKSLRYGSVFVYQSMPRLLSIWFDYGTRLLDVKDTTVMDQRKNNLIKMTMLISSALDTLPPYIFLTAFSQLVSRICHPQKEVHVQLKSIIIKLLLHYPQQSLWMIISVMKSSYSVRKKRCAEIFADPQLRAEPKNKLVQDFTLLAEKLIELCNKEIAPDVETVTVSSLLRILPRLLKQPNFSEIMIPTHKFRKLVLPNPDFSSSQHNPFPNHYVHIVGIDEQVTILRSLQRPRKITFRGSDGKGYVQMLKPKDDLRKDFRLMEFNDIVNQLLSRESESRQRRLNIRLYSVSPLNEECGLIEWIPNLVGLRPILQNLYKQRGGAMSTRELKEANCNIRDTLSKKRDVFTNVLLRKHPPLLGEWFRRTFPDAQSWFFARMAYIRTTAVISMVGYILGLGDRHGENILFDSICGDTVHVDFNCLFNKGESFDWPERVPFRLTHNMVAAMGPLGVEGVFRKSCACTLRVLRDNIDTLMSIVTPFVYDPLVSWPRNSTASISNTAERTNEQAVDHVKNIERRLQGIVTTSTRCISIPLSIDGQTNILINEAMDIDNLCQMYIGWGAYL